MKNMTFEEFKDIISQVNHDIEFSWNGKTYWFNILNDSICINVMRNKDVISYNYFHPKSTDFSSMIDEFLEEKIFDGKKLSEIDSEIEVLSYT